MSFILAKPGDRTPKHSTGSGPEYLDFSPICPGSGLPLLPATMKLDESQARQMGLEVLKGN
jgi:hypothetical protein